MDRDGVLVDAGGLGGDRSREAGRLRRRPDLDLAGGDARGAVDRLHRRVGEVGRAIGLLDVARRAGLGARDVAAAVEGEAAVVRRRRARSLFQMRHDGARVEPSGRPLPPLDLDRGGAALRMPGRAADDRERRRRAAVGAEADDALDAGERERRRDVDRTGAAAEHRAVADRREQQAGRSHVDAEAGAAVALGGGVDARRGAADQAPLLARLQAHLAGRRRRRHARELAVVRRAARADG